MVILGVSAIVYDLLDGFSDVFLHFESLAKSRKRVFPCVLAIERFLCVGVIIDDRKR